MACRQFRAGSLSNASFRADSRQKRRLSLWPPLKSSYHRSSFARTAGSSHKVLATPSQEKLAMLSAAPLLKDSTNVDFPHPTPPVTTQRFISSRRVKQKKNGKPAALTSRLDRIFEDHAYCTAGRSGFGPAAAEASDGVVTPAVGWRIFAPEGSMRLAVTKIIRFRL